MSNQGYSNGLTSLAVLSLVKESIIYKNEGADRDGDAVIYYSLSEKGRDMLLERYADIKREEEEAARQATANRNAAWGRAGQLSASDDDDVPF
jgi:DNA-binding PadR family transcriptional regulator